MISRNPNTFVVGGGQVATALAGALRSAGVPVLGLWARRPEQARAASAASGVAAFSAAPPDLLLEAQAVVVAVSDDAISEVAAMLVGTGLVGNSHVLVHCSGVLSAERAFESVAGRVAGIAALHPLRAIPDGRAAIADMDGTVFGVDGDALGRQVANNLAVAIGGKVLELSGQGMAAYHAAAATASNYLIPLLDAAVDMLERAGIERGAGLAALVPLVRGTLDNAERVASEPAGDLASALTGPIQRGDVDTVARHLGAIADLEPAVVELYRQLGLRTVALARRAEAAPEQALDAIESLLTAGEPPIATAGDAT